MLPRRKNELQTNGGLRVKAVDKGAVDEGADGGRRRELFRVWYINLTYGSQGGVFRLLPYRRG